MMLIELATLSFFPAMMAFAASSDLFTMTISNRVSVLLVLGFVAMAIAVGMAPSDIAAHFGAAAAVLAVSFFFFSRGWIGGGDAKLAAACALWLGWAHLYDYLLYASLLGGGLTLLLIQFRKLSLPAVLGGREWAERLHRPNGGIPYGIALAAAALLVYPSTVWMGAAAP
jgi:prepilin peptidase CpaA